MSRRHPDRRQFLTAVGSVAVGAGLAGCGGNGEEDEFDVTVRVVNNAPAAYDPETPAGGAGGEFTPDVNPKDSESLEITENILQRAGPKGLVVAGNVENTSDQTFAEILVEATLYDGREREDNILDSTSNQTRKEDLEAGNVWQWAVKFRDDPEFVVDYYSVTISGRYA